MKKNCSQNILLTILFVLFIVLAGAGIYFLLKEKNTDDEKILNKYQEIVNFCDAEESSTDLSIECKALLLNVTTGENNNNCFEVEIISKNNSLEDFKFCESSEILSYENSILEYKRLKPFNIQMRYSKEDSATSFALQSIYFTPVDETYIQGIINKDIENLVNTQIDRELTPTATSDGRTYLGTDQSTYTITNSVDFCPSPSNLPEYITDKEAYETFYNKYILSEEDYVNLSEDDKFGEILGKLFACDSANKLQFNTCPSSANKNMSAFPQTITKLTRATITWGSKMNLMSRVYLKEISALYNNISATKKYTDSYVTDFDTLVKSMNTEEDLNEIAFCSLPKVLKPLSSQNDTYKYNEEYIQTIILSNLTNVTTAECTGILPSSLIDSEGAYIHIYFKNLENKNIFRIYTQCTNLSTIIK